jgi:hypothetical protein
MENPSGNRKSIWKLKIHLETKIHLEKQIHLELPKSFRWEKSPEMASDGKKSSRWIFSHLGSLPGQAPPPPPLDRATCGFEAKVYF